MGTGDLKSQSGRRSDHRHGRQYVELPDAYKSVIEALKHGGLKPSDREHQADRLAGRGSAAWKC
ncbi:hypothetical protein M8494_23580 [Serratia ureilytica]